MARLGPRRPQLKVALETAGKAKAPIIAAIVRFFRRGIADKRGLPHSQRIQGGGKIGGRSSS
jgi:hypothetical protein